jgi:superfamily I DNA and/or RNA helicase/predicted DNA-binding WGR domain protein
MSGESDNSFLQFLRQGIENGGFGADDALAAILPLMRQVAEVHENGLVAPLAGVHDLKLNEQGIPVFDLAKAKPPEKNLSRIEQLQRPLSQAVEIIGQMQRTSDLDAGTHTVVNLGVAEDAESIKKPVYIPHYKTWEHAVGHHDELTDIFSLGMILASFACGLDFTDAGDLELFADHRNNLFGLNSRLNPVVATVIVELTELNRHRRAQDLRSIIRRLEHYRDQETEFTFKTLKGFDGSNVSGKRTLVQTHLRDRLFEISRRNRLIYFKPTLQTLNFTVASVPVLLDYRNIKLEQLFLWHSDLAKLIADGAPLSLGKYLRFEDAPYIPGVLDKIISEARRDRAEYGFAQLRLVLCFLRWHNLKESPDERIDSPLLLLPVELTRKKGVRDNYVLDPTTSEAEVNPALRHHLKQLYDLNLPESIDLRETSLDAFHEQLKQQIHASEPAVILNKIDRPQIQLIHARARQRVDQYRRRLELKAKPKRNHGPFDYSYDRENFRPLGLQLFLKKVQPKPIPLSDIAGAAPKPRVPHMVDSEGAGGGANVLTTEREMFALAEGQNQNRYSWDFDLCSLTLGNFNYRKMTLVRDYSNLIETDMASAAFDTIFSLTPRSTEEPADPLLELSDQYFIVACDATQASAIARARTGRSYIIQGPPGTGKSQTITNLIADYVARGKRVLFVCEKRAAIDVVFHRLRQQGLDELCCLIHDSQTDKKQFIQNLKQTYEQFLSRGETDNTPDLARLNATRALEQDLSALRRFSEAMRQVPENCGLNLRQLLHRLVELRPHATSLSPEQEERLPEYRAWIDYGQLVVKLASTLVELGYEPCLASHPLRLVGRAIIEADRPLETLARHLDEAEAMLDAIESALELSGLSPELWDTMEEIEALLGFAVTVHPLAEWKLLDLLDPQSATTTKYRGFVAEWEKKQQTLTKAHQKTGNWKERLPVEDIPAALAQARAYEGSIFRFLHPGFWRLRNILQARYDFSRHVVPPGWLQILTELNADYEAAAACEQVLEKVQQELRVTDLQALQEAVTAAAAGPAASHPSIQAFRQQLIHSPEAPQLVHQLCEIQPKFARFSQVLAALLAEFRDFDFAQLNQAIREMRDESGALPELLPSLAELLELPEQFSNALRFTRFRPEEFETALGQKSLNRIYRTDRHLIRIDGRTMLQRIDRLAANYRDFLTQNGKWIRARVQRKFLEHVNISSLSATQLDPEQKAFKKQYSAGRRDLEHEFGKTMRYKSIRDLAAGPSGQVVQDLKPIWLMSPLSVSDTLPLDPNLFDVVIFDEASQIPLEEAIPALYRSNQLIVVGDEMQLPPTTFFSSTRAEDETVVVEEQGERIEVDLDSDSFLNQSAQNLSSTLLAWHYRSRFESLISFSNAAFYGGNLFTVPDRQLPTGALPEIRVNSSEQGATNVDALLARSISFHFLENGVYEQRRNPREAAYIAEIVRELLLRQTKLSIGIVAFSEAQQTEIEDALERLARDNESLSALLEAEFAREENDQFCGLFVKNLENVQGDERDIIIMSVCYGYDSSRRMLMNFGPINQKGGEKRLNVIFSRAKHHMAIVSSIRHHDITNEYNDGANSLRNFLQYADAISRGDAVGARRVLEGLNPLSRKSLAPETEQDAVVTQLAEKLRSRGMTVAVNVGQSRFRCDLAIRAGAQPYFQLGVLVDTAAHYANANPIERYLMQPAILRAFGWKFALVLTKDWYHDPDAVLQRIERLLKNEEQPEDSETLEPIQTLEAPPPAPHNQNQKSIDPLSHEQPQSQTKTAADPARQSEVSAKLRRFEFKGGGSNKFWEISLDDTALSVRFGRIGTEGQIQTRIFEDRRRAVTEASKLIQEKLRKGYVEADA